ncbi:MAG: hypothetical protein H6622_00200 [Halobacteriovoraceae bacterium]|nr:hypothetical protein [Halobacteriovoraceae bacterium]
MKTYIYIILNLIFLQSLIAKAYVDCFDFPAQNQSLKNNIGISAAESYYETLNYFKSRMSLEVELYFGKYLDVKIDERTSRAKVYTTKDNQHNPIIYVSRPFLEHSMLTEDVLLMFLCHELGHHLGGAPKKMRNDNTRGWDSVEGQADFFASSKCLPKIFREADNKRQIDKYPQKLREDLEKRCGANIYCQRVSKTALDFASMIATFKPYWKAPSLRAKDLFKIGRTLHTHPAPQCRLDTLISGAHCSFKHKIPFDSTNISQGSCLDELTSWPQALRPGCWFNSKDY